MAEFLVKVADERGRVLEQLEHGFSEKEVRERFVQQGLLVYSIKPRGALLGAPLGRRPGRLRLETFIVFNQQFITLIRAGLPILLALELLSKRQRNRPFKSLLENVRDRVRSGEVLSQAFAAQGLLPRIYTTTLLAGEKSGNLEEVLSRYVAFQRVTMAFRRKLLTSLVYPALLVALVVVMLTFLITYVVPQFAELYSQLKQQLPPITTFMLEMGVAAKKYFVPFLVGLVVVVVGLWRWSGTPAGGERLDQWRLRLPLLGGIWLKYQIALFSRMMATLLAGGLPLVQALDTAGSSIESKFVARSITKAVEQVREGRPLSRSLEETGIVPELAVEMIEVGESTGALSAMLTSVAEFYEDDVQTALAATLSLIEPVILVGMGLVVGVVLISLYLPIFSLGAGAAAAR